MLAETVSQQSMTRFTAESAAAQRILSTAYFCWEVMKKAFPSLKAALMYYIRDRNLEVRRHFQVAVVEVSLHRDGVRVSKISYWLPRSHRSIALP